MNYYKVLDVNCTLVSQSLRNYIKSQPENYLTGFWTNSDTHDVLQRIPELQYLFDPLNITIKSVSFLMTRAAPIHTDQCLESVRINLPIENCENSFTQFFVSKSAPSIRYLPNGVPYNYINPIDCVLVDQFTLTRPTAIRVHEPHAVHVPGRVLRLSCTIAFHENIEYLLE